MRYLLGMAQMFGAFAGVMAAHSMFGLPTLGEGLGEIITTFSLVVVIALASKFHVDAIPMVVAAFITSAYLFTSSTSLANPAVTFARAMTKTFAGISPQSVANFIGGQIIGAVMATLVAGWLAPADSNRQ